MGWLFVKSISWHRMGDTVQAGGRTVGKVDRAESLKAHKRMTSGWNGE